MQLTYKRVWSGCSTVESKNGFSGEKEAKQGWPIDHISEYPYEPSHNPGIKQYKSYTQFEEQRTRKSISNCNSRADPGHPTHTHENPKSDLRSRNPG